jgi:hypothetical protein
MRAWRVLSLALDEIGTSFLESMWLRGGVRVWGGVCAYGRLWSILATHSSRRSFTTILGRTEYKHQAREDKSP